MTDDTRKAPELEVDKETLKDLEATEADDVKGGASGTNNCGPLTENTVERTMGKLDIDAAG